MATLGYLGLGKMGRPMVKNLLKGGHKVIVWNRSAGPVDEMVVQGAVRGASPRDVAEQAEVVFSCLSTPDVVHSVLTGPGGALEGAKAGALFIDHSTIGVSDCKRLFAACAAKGVGFLDAPVSGGPWGAEAGSLAIMIGGNQIDFERGSLYLELLGKNIRYLGPAGSGAVAKLCNQLLVGAHTAAINEAFVLATKAGVDPALLFEVISAATGNSAQMQRNLPQFVFAGNFNPAFSVDFLHKDVALCNNLGRELQVRMTMGALTEQLLTEARAMGMGEQDYTALIRPLEQQAGVEVRAEVKNQK